MEYLIKELGFPIAMASALVGTFVWLSKTLISHFIKQMNVATQERQAMTTRFAETVENHISGNTKALKEVSDQLREARAEHTEMIHGLDYLKNK